MSQINDNSKRKTLNFKFIGHLNFKIWNLEFSHWAGGETGKHDRFRTYCRKVCGFKSRPAHQDLTFRNFPTDCRQTVRERHPELREGSKLVLNKKFFITPPALRLAQKWYMRTFSDSLEPMVPFPNWRCLFENIRTEIARLGGQNSPGFSFCPPAGEAVFWQRRGFFFGVGVPGQCRSRKYLFERTARIGDIINQSFPQ